MNKEKNKSSKKSTCKKKYSWSVVSDASSNTKGNAQDNRERSNYNKNWDDSIFINGHSDC